MQNELTAKRAKLTIIAMCLVTLVLFGVKLYIQTEYSVESGTLDSFNMQIKNVKMQNEILQNQISQEESYANIETKAKAMGFRDTTDKDYIYLQ